MLGDVGRRPLGRAAAKSTVSQMNPRRFAANCSRSCAAAHFIRVSVVVIGALHCGAMQLSTQLCEGNISKRLHRLIDIDLPRGTALSTLSARCAKHILPVQKVRQRHLVDLHDNPRS